MLRHHSALNAQQVQQLTKIGRSFGVQLPRCETTICVDITSTVLRVVNAFALLQAPSLCQKSAGFRWRPSAGVLAEHPRQFGGLVPRESRSSVLGLGGRQRSRNKEQALVLSCQVSPRLCAGVYIHITSIAALGL